jgi:hypothetical protein
MTDSASKKSGSAYARLLARAALSFVAMYL